MRPIISTKFVPYIGGSLMLRISKLADYSILIMRLFAVSPEASFNANTISAKTDLNPPTVKKLLKLLQSAGLVESTRGPQGGYMLARAPDEISLAAVIVAVDGPISVTKCILHNDSCDRSATCGAKANWQIVNDVIESALSNVSIFEMGGTLQRESAPVSTKIVFEGACV